MGNVFFLVPESWRLNVKLMHYPEDSFLVHFQVQGEPPVSVGGIGYVIFLDFLFDFKIPNPHFALMIDIFMVYLHT